MAALHGEVRAIATPCAAWRRHGRNMSKHDPSTLADKLADDLEVVELVNAVLRRRKGRAALAVAAWPHHLRQRLTLAKLLPDRRISSDDSVARLAIRYINAVWRWPAYSVRKRLAATAWALMFAVLPCAVLTGIASDATRLTSLIYRLMK